jgi:hypothetical protein
VNGTVLPRTAASAKPPVNGPQPKSTTIKGSVGGLLPKKMRERLKQLLDVSGLVPVSVEQRPVRTCQMAVWSIKLRLATTDHIVEDLILVYPIKILWIP